MNVRSFSVFAADTMPVSLCVWRCVLRLCELMAARRGGGRGRLRQCYSRNSAWCHGTTVSSD